jgi:hypothetical protein
MDSHHVDADPDLDPSFYFDVDLDLDPDLKFNLIQNRILLLIKVMQICNHWSTDPPRLHFEHLQLLNFGFDADPYPASKIMRIRIRNSGMYSKNAHITAYYGITQRTIFTKCNRNYIFQNDWQLFSERKPITKKNNFLYINTFKLVTCESIQNLARFDLPPTPAVVWSLACCKVHEINESHLILVTAFEEAFLLAALDSEFGLLVNSKPEEVDCFISKHEGLRCVSIISEVAQHVVQPEIK